MILWHNPYCFYKPTRIFFGINIMNIFTFDKIHVEGECVEVS